MIITRSWLENFIDIEGIETQEICKILNQIGLEVDSYRQITFPKGVVVGKVLSCEKHPDADKLNVCQVEIGEETKQIVCGAKNVTDASWVAVATVGADLGEGFVIKEAKLRGVDSHGMICSSTELGLPAVEPGIWKLDESMGDLKSGVTLNDLPNIADEVIEIELTANRGDCLSIYGVARDLSAALDRQLYPIAQTTLKEIPTPTIAIESDLPIALAFSCMERDQLRPINALERYRLALVEKLSENGVENLLSYVTHATGVILSGYNHCYQAIKVKEEAGIATVYGDEKEISILGVSQREESRVDAENPSVLIEASYIDPDALSRAMMGKKIQKDTRYYHTSRGSDPDLQRGFAYLVLLLGQEQCELHTLLLSDPFRCEIILSHQEIERFIGISLKSEAVTVPLKRLGFEVEEKGDGYVIKVPHFRHDINNQQDVIEEIVRMIGIDHIPSNAQQVVLKHSLNASFENYKKRNYYRTKAVGVGFSEAIHYFFESKEALEKYGLATLPQKLDLRNPISQELDTLRTTLLLHHIRSASLNIKNGKNRVMLFEIGKVVDVDRNETTKMAFVMSGDREVASIHSGAKPKPVDFVTFSSKVLGVVGACELLPAQTPSALFNPYEVADIIIKGRCVGVMGALHIDLREAYDLPRTYLCEIDFEALDFSKVEAKSYAKYPQLSRDLSFLKPKTVPFSQIRLAIEEKGISHLRSLFPVDLYRSEEMGEHESVTMRAILQSDEKTLDETEIETAMNQILETITTDLGLELR